MATQRRQKKAASRAQNARRARAPNQKPKNNSRSNTKKDACPDVCPVVGIGASAGGLDAFKQLFKAMPANTGAAFVLIQHLDPTHESLTAELVGRHTSMSIVEVPGRAAQVEANHVYVIPPNKYLAIERGQLKVSEPVERRGLRMPIDFFLRSLATECKERAIGIILSGSGTDGTRGLLEVKASGGLTIAQDPVTCQHENMPRSAINSGGADHVLPVGEMPDVLKRYISHSYVCEAPTDDESPAQEPAGQINAIIAILRAKANFDFTHYKRGTLNRRVHRRMSLRHFEKLGDYVKSLRDDPKEVTALFKDLLIHVSSFFREPKAWEVLRDEAIKPIVRAKQSGEPIRAWVPGCATGEEAYTVAMLLIEELNATKKSCPIQVFASDVDAGTLNIGRAGNYPDSVAADVSDARLRHFFVSGDSRYRVTKELREVVIFAQQNVFADPPFSRLDLVCCRNVMIYLNADVQKRLLSLVHFALTDSGYLFLGTSESIGGLDSHFETISKKWRIYRRFGSVQPDQMQFQVNDTGRKEPPRKPEGIVTPAKLASAVQRLLVDRHAPACVVINHRYEIVHYSGKTGQYFKEPPGSPTQNVLSKTSGNLQNKLRSAIFRAINENKLVDMENVEVKHDGKRSRIRLVVDPLHGQRETEGLLMISLYPEKIIAKGSKKRTEPTHASEIDALELELRDTREDLQSTIEELETSNEELKAANEEVMSINEELQSANEELETSKEELQSLNEELSTVNSQLEGKVTELESSNDDLNNLLVGTGVATLILDTKLRVRRFTPAMTDLCRLIPSDVGRPISDLAWPNLGKDLVKVAESVLRDLIPAETELETETNRWFYRRVVPYRTEDNRIDGTVITFMDITDRKLAETQIESFHAAHSDAAAQKSAERIAAISGGGILTVDAKGRIESLNGAAVSMFHYTNDELAGQPLSSVMEQSSADKIKQILSSEVPLFGITLEVVGKDKDGNSIPLELRIGQVLRHKNPKYLMSVRNIQFRENREANLQAIQKTFMTLAETERRRIGMELHDHLGQIIAGTSMLARSLQHRIAEKQPAEAHAIEGVVQQLRNASSLVRDLSRGLAPMVTDTTDLGQTLSDLAERTQSVYGVDCEYACSGDGMAPSLDVSEHLYRIAHEAVSNAVRHGRPKKIDISLDAKNSDLILTIKDDGDGIPAGKLEAGLGHRIMRHRATLIGANLDIGPDGDNGTIVKCTLSVDNGVGGV